MFSKDAVLPLAMGALLLGGILTSSPTAYAVSITIDTNTMDPDEISGLASLRRLAMTWTAFSSQ